MSARTIIIDHGSGFLKAGLSGLNEPQMVIPSIVSYLPCRENPGPSSARRRLILGISSDHPDTFSYPIQRGRVLNWEAVENIWTVVVKKCRRGHEDSPVIITESPLREPVDRRKTLEIMFESLNVPSILLADQLEMSLYASGLLTGVVVDSGHGLTRVQPFHLGGSVRTGGRTLEFGGQDLSAYLFKSLFQEECNEHDLFQMDTVTTIQMKRCFVPPSFEEALGLHQRRRASRPDKSNTYQLPDGTALELTAMQRMAPEMFFSPQRFDLPGPGLSQVVRDSVETCDASVQPVLASHVMACGGNTLCTGFTKRLFNELTTDHFPSIQVSMSVGSNRNFSVWLGASVVAHLSTYGSQWLTKEEYDEQLLM
ncbi:actin-like protein 8 [Talpa occidentalis]|uniref:actin-like protein 8 n=1 Tax=Talpa occidentalis TaxID=50954 RepID=UPI00188F9DC3|nr:actin-like protein 8 [Talpa occidentalis]XP_037355568.1 actin-like protein 8 [Talpa occidentalis]XP_037355569.1 actin-like protein 8 [Talpa occidentalis]XP_054547496.1 actin-like protein 8 [Talpa occidentalis]